MCSERSTPLSYEIIYLWTEGSLRGKVLRKYRRQINSELALASFKSNKEIVQKWYNPSFIVEGTPYMHFGELYPPTGS